MKGERGMPASIATAASAEVDAANIRRPATTAFRSNKDFRTAKHHSLFVSVLKKVFPASAVALVAFFFGSAIWSFVPDVDFSIAGIGLENGKLVMKEPKMAGFDKKDRPFDVRAVRAVQDLKKPNMVELITIKAQVPMDEDSFADVTARFGFYDTEKQSLVLREDVLISGARGMDVRLLQANIDMKTGSMTSNEPVSVSSKDTDLWADSVMVKDNGARIIFRNRVKMIIRRPLKKEATLRASR